MRAIPREVNDSLVRDAGEAYALGLWCADSYWRSSSIGLSNVEPELIIRFARYLSRVLGPDRLRLRIYQVEGDPPDPRVLGLTEKVSVCAPFKMRHTAYHVYVNSRELVRFFFSRRGRLSEIPPSFVGPYVAGRFDGDGNLGTRVRIAYTREEEASCDAILLQIVGIRTSVLYYSTSSEYCIYLHKCDETKFIELISPFSWKAGHFTP